MRGCAVVVLIGLSAGLTLHGQSVVQLTRDVLNDYGYKPDVPLADGSPFQTLNERAFAKLKDIAGSTDIAVEVRAESRRCAFTAGETFVNSDWSFRVLEVFKNNSAGTIARGGLITVTQRS